MFVSTWLSIPFQQCLFPVEGREGGREGGREEGREGREGREGGG